MAFNQSFTSSTGFTFDSDKTEFVAGKCQQKDKSPANSSCWATYTTDINLNVSPNGGVLTGVATGGAAIAGNKLDLAHSDTRYVDYNADLNADSQQVGTIKFKVTPNYTGNPGNDMYFFTITKEASSRVNELSFYHKTSGSISLRIYNSSGVLAGESTFVSWSPTSGVEYEFEVTYDLTTGANRFFIDGVQQGATSTVTTTRDNLIGLMRIGSSYNAGVSSNFSIADLIIYSTVQHTANYTPGYTLEETRYLEDIITLPQFTTASEISDYLTFVTTENGALRFNLDSKYYSGGWVSSDNSYSQMNSTADTNTNISTLTPQTSTLDVKMRTVSDNTQEWIDDLTVTFGEIPVVDAGTDKSCTDHQTIAPFSDCSFSDDGTVTNAYYKIVGEVDIWTEISQGAYASLLLAVQAFTYTFDNLGTITASLKVKDDGGFETEDSLTVTVSSYATTFNVKTINDIDIEGITFDPGDGDSTSVVTSPFSHSYDYHASPLTANFSRDGFFSAYVLIEQGTLTYSVVMQKILYCYASEVRDVLPAVTIAKFNNTLIENKIEYAQSLINGYLASRYTVPFATTPPLIKTICIDIAAYYVLRTLFTRDSINRSGYLDDFLLKHLNIEKKTGTIYDIVNGILTIVDEVGTELSTSVDDITSDTKDYVPIFDVDDPKNWKDSTSRLDDIGDARDAD